MRDFRCVRFNTTEMLLKHDNAILVAQQRQENRKQCSERNDTDRQPASGSRVVAGINQAAK